MYIVFADTSGQAELISAITALVLALTTVINIILNRNTKKAISNVKEAIIENTDITVQGNEKTDGLGKQFDGIMSKQKEDTASQEAALKKVELENVQLKAEKDAIIAGIELERKLRAEHALEIERIKIELLKNPMPQAEPTRE